MNAVPDVKGQKNKVETAERGAKLTGTKEGHWTLCSERFLVQRTRRCEDMGVGPGSG